MVRFAFAAVLLSYGLSVATTAARAQATEPVQVPVQTEDLNLRSAAGHKTLDHRLAQAADQACGSSAGTHDLAALSAERRCRAQARQSGNAQATTIVARQEAREQAQRMALMARASETGRLSANRSKQPRSAHQRRAKHAVHHRRTRSHHPVQATRRSAR